MAIRCRPAVPGYYVQSDGGRTPFFPFDCSAIYWNNAVPLPMPESDTVDRAGSLKGINVLLRPVSADTLEALVNAATSYYFASETRNATNALNSPPPDGFLIRSDEDKQLVETPPAVNFNDYTGLAQWHELQGLSTQLLHTPFNAEGIITNITVDANGTRQIALLKEPEGYHCGATWAQPCY